MNIGYYDFHDMASQVSHTVYAKKYLDKNPLKETDGFVLGNLFPDVRRVGNFKRRDTHLVFEDLNLDFSELSAFEAGWKFHLWCDMRREEILNSHNFYSLNRAADFAGLPAKLLEDELLYDKYNNWEKLNLILNSPPRFNFNIKIDIPREVVERWYAMLAKYFEKKPNDQTMKIFLSKQPSLANRVDEIVDLVKKLRNNSKAVEILEKIAEDITA